MPAIQTILIVKHQHGLHARPADLFVRKANEFQAAIQVGNITRPSKPVNAKSILGILALGVHSGDSIEISAEGSDGAAAIDALTSLVNGNFGE
jgi:phosphocarrier protein HPr